MSDPFSQIPSVHRAADGTVVIHLLSGDRVTVKPDGEIEVRDDKGAVSTFHHDGSEFHRPLGRWVDGHTHYGEPPKLPLNHYTPPPASQP